MEALHLSAGPGGIFSPTLFFGAAAGFAVAKVASGFLPLNASDHTALAVAGMSACLGAVVRATLTSILIVFEMTHQFTFVPILMIGTFATVSYRRVPLVLDGKVAGVISRSEALSNERPELRWESAICVAPSVTIREAVQRMVNESQELILLTSNPDGKLLGIVTLHDVLRFQNQFSVLRPES